jgi:thioredoxin
MTKTMQRFGLLAVGVLAIAGSTVRPLRAEEDVAKKHGPIAWTESLPNAQKQAVKDKKVVMVDFWAEWCGPCKQMLATTYKDKAVVTQSKKFVPVLVDVDKQASLAKKYNVEAIPTVIFMDGKGKVLGRSVGFVDKTAFLKLMNDAAKKL